ncbi:MAG: S16 family serine protease [Nitrosopumilaceae archaeon]|nr:S16 family serine protease [Nitrosopumilaceae archaeon]
MENLDSVHNLKILNFQDQISLSKKNILNENKTAQHSINLSNYSPYPSQSITSVGVMPVLIHDGFFEKTVYEGTNMDISISIREGTGNVLVDTKIPTGVEFQNSARAAVKASEKYLEVDLSDKDIIFSISAHNDSKLTSVDGHSAGAAMAVLLISELSGMNVQDDVVITGTIEDGNKVGKVGGIYEKAKAAGMSGAKLFLVPKNQDMTVIESCQESIKGSIIYRTCQLETKPISPITEEQFGMKVIGVESIDQALNYLLEK